jgi:23S rRNA (cytosine1962-C5)-methyltransferase
MPESALTSILEQAIEHRSALFDPEHQCAIRLFNGFTEGCSDLVVDLYADAAVFHNYADPPERGQVLIETAIPTVQKLLPWIRSVLVKTRAGASDHIRRGVHLLGDSLPKRVREHGIWYALDLTLHQDCTLYLDTRALRKWAKETLGGMSVLNAFSYTGSLGVAALGGGAQRVVQLDRNRRFLDIAQASYALNGYPINKADFVAADFFRESARLRRRKDVFECVFLDPPFFSSSPSGLVDQEQGGARLINKVRPLVARGGYLVAINNALFVSGASWMQDLQSLCTDGYLEIQELIPVPDDFMGWTRGQQPAWITDPAPFNHSTKIAVLKVL